MIKSFVQSLRGLLSLLLVLALVSCNSGISGGLNSFQSPDGRYGFLFPTGWTRVSVDGGPQVLFHDLINADETLSLVISKLNSDISLEELGSPEDVANKLIDDVISSDGTNREVELVEAKKREKSDHTFYDLEYKVHTPQIDRHEIASVVLDKGFLYTFSAGTNDYRWSKVKELLYSCIVSFSFFI